MAKSSYLSSAMMSPRAIRQLASFRCDPNCRTLHWALTALEPSKVSDGGTVKREGTVISDPLLLSRFVWTWPSTDCSG